jgi:hypothetical protein
MPRSRNKRFEAVVINNVALNVKGELMKKLCLRFLIALIGVAGLGVATKGQAVDQVVVKIPREFVVAGKTLPAGTYRVDRLRSSVARALVLSSFENRASAIVIPTEVESSKADKAVVTFEQVGGELFLSKVETPDNVFTLPVSRSAIMEAAAKSHSGAPSSESAAGSF